MGLLINKETLLVHIPKTGGSTMIRNFKSNGHQCTWEGAHAPIQYLITRCKQEKLDLDDIHVVSVVRNPWTKMFSTWRFFSCLNFNEFYSGDKDIDLDFNKWVKWVYTDFDRNKKDRGKLQFNMFKYHFTEQLNWFKDEEGDIVEIDNILKTEKLTEQMSEIAEQYDWKKVEAVVNKTNNSKVGDDIHSLINQESIDLIGEAYKGDLEAFDYDYERR